MNLKRAKKGLKKKKVLFSRRETADDSSGLVKTLTAALKRTWSNCAQGPDLHTLWDNKCRSFKDTELVVVLLNSNR